MTTSPTMYNFQIGQAYTFNSIAPALLGAQFINATLLSIMDFQIAINFSNVAQSAQAIAPLLPAGVSSDPTTYVYLLFETTLGTKIVIAYQWIDPTSITVSSGITINITVNNAGNSDITTLTNTLNILGYTNYTIKST